MKSGFNKDLGILKTGTGAKIHRYPNNKARIDQRDAPSGVAER